MIFSPLAHSVFQAIEQADGKVYIVGGSVRDEVLNIKQGHDIDVEVYGLTYQQLCDVLSAFGEVNTFGQSFAIVQLSTLKGYDFALPRQEKKTGDKHQDFEIMIDPYLSLEKAILRRDLTMNALMYDYSADKIVDLCGGQNDIFDKVIRCVDENTFVEDPLRVLRIAQFRARFDMQVEEKTKALCQKMVEQGMLEHLSMERVYHEYNKILMSPKPSLGFIFLKDIGALPSYLHALTMTMQRLDYHPEGDVFTHTMMVIDEATKVRNQADEPLSFMWSCLFHDLGKPLVTTSEGHAPKHNEAGVEVFKHIHIIASKKQRDYISTMIMYHMHLMNMSRHHSRDIKYLRLLKEINQKVSMNDLILLTRCDKLGRGRIVHEQLDDFDAFIEDKIQRLGIKAKTPLVGGKDLIDYGYTQKTLFKEMLKEAYDLQLQGLSKQQILRSLRKYEQG